MVKEVFLKECNKHRIPVLGDYFKTFIDECLNEKEKTKRIK